VGEIHIGPEDMRLTSIYTKVGDKGTTMLASGAKVPKDSPRIEAYGTVDELNAFLGLFRDKLQASGSGCDDLIAALLKIQNEMHDIGGELSTPAEHLNTAKQQVVGTDGITRLEHEMDRFNETLKPLANFILPGGHELVSLSHICRTVCRRAERLVVTLSHVETIRDEPRIYLNRLSDWLFVAGRVVASRLNVTEILWKQAGKS
jgi:cob(I)alamin adenosyltransferase